jgi:hypothetical protein
VFIGGVPLFSHPPASLLSDGAYGEIARRPEF